MITDPDGQTDPEAGNFYGLKRKFLFEIETMRATLTNLHKLVYRQDEVLNDATRIAVYKELVADLKKEHGFLSYDNAYTGGLEESIRRLEGAINYLSKYGWAKKLEQASAAP